MLDHYLGVYFTDTSGCFHYGWIRCDVKNEGKELVIKDFAFELKCETGILAGDIIGDTTTVGIIESNSLDATVYSFNHTIYLNLNTIIDDIEIHVYDVTGNEVYSDKITNQFTQIELVVAKGVYFIEIFYSNQMLSKKIYIY